MTIATDKCLICSEPIDQTSDRCLTCGTDIGAPNVRSANSVPEVNGLQTRYDDAVFRATARGAGDSLLAFQKALARTGAVINCNLSFLKDFVTESKTLYANYHAAVQGGVRKVALPDRDQERTVVDSILFRSYAPSIRMAALSLTNREFIHMAHTR